MTSILEAFNGIQIVDVERTGDEASDGRKDWEAHRTALQAFLAGGKMFTMIADSRAHYIISNEAVSALAEELYAKNPHWDVASLQNASYSVDPFALDIGSRDTEHFWKVSQLPWGSGGYLASRAGAEFLLAQSAAEPLPFDCYLRFRAQLANVYLIRKPVVFLGRGVQPEYNLPSNCREVCNVIVPYRDRAANLRGLLEGFGERVWTAHRILVVEQDPSDGKPFNRAKLANVGYALLKQLEGYICVHDVDLVPESPSCDYSRPVLPTHMSRLNSQTNYASTYDGAMGGVTLFTKQHFEKLNGYSNEYWGWGLEDDDLKQRCTAAGLKTVRRYGRYFSQTHKEKCRGPFTGTPQERAELVKDVSPHWLENYCRLRKGYDFQKEGLNTLSFTKLRETQFKGATIVTVSI